MNATEIAPGLWRWTAPHPDWHADAEPESPQDWPREVGSVLYAPPGGEAVFVDPQLPPDPAPFWAWADERVKGRSVFVVTTIEWHDRSRDAFFDRYGASSAAPQDVELVPFPATGETMVWLAEPRALVPGDRIIGASGGGLRLCPESWLPGEGTIAELRELLRPLLELPVERVLVPHGEPVLERGREALSAALS